MKIIEICPLAVPDVQFVRFARFHDQRGYFCETYRRERFSRPILQAACFRGVEFVQHNESHSRPGTIRGLHFQWNPGWGNWCERSPGR